MNEGIGTDRVEPRPRAKLIDTLRQAPVSALIIAINVVVFVLAERTGSTKDTDTLLRFGAVWRGAVWQGQYWRLATSMFLHIGVVHLIWNAWFGFRMSARAERELGRWRFIVLYLASGVVAAATSVIGHDAVAAGASGALFGLIGWRLAALRAELGSFKAFAAAPGARQRGDHHLGIAPIRARVHRPRKSAPDDARSRRR